MILTLFYAHIALAILSMLVGMFHMVYCCLFFNSAVGIWNAILLFAVGFYGICQFRPSRRFLVSSHAILLISGLCVMVLNGVGIHCNTIGSCTNLRSWYDPVQSQCFKKFKDSPALLQDMARVHVVIHSLLLVESVIQVLLSITVISKNCVQFYFDIRQEINIHVMLLGISVVGFSFGCVHTLYCSHLFFLFTGVWANVGVATVALLRNRKRLKRKNSDAETDRIDSDDALINESFNRHSFILDRIVGAAGAVCTIALISVGLYGSYCWYPHTQTHSAFQTPKLDHNQTITTPQTCASPDFFPKIYQFCYDNLQSVGYWNSGQDPVYLWIGKLQQGMSVLLVLFGLAEMFFLAFIELGAAREWLKFRNTVPPVDI